MTTPQTKLTAAKRELELALELCPHWDYESDGDRYDCCYRVDDAKRDLKQVKLLTLKTG